jgi:hypothetical protein
LPNAQNVSAAAAPEDEAAVVAALVVAVVVAVVGAVVLDVATPAVALLVVAALAVVVDEALVAALLAAWLVAVAAVDAGTALLVDVDGEPEGTAVVPPQAARRTGAARPALQPTRARSSCRRVAGRDNWPDTRRSFHEP